MSLTDYAAETWISVMFGIGSLPTTWYACLLADEPGPQWDGSLVADLEPPALPDYVGTVYERQPIAPGSTDWGVSDSGFVYNKNDISFGTPDDIWGSLTYFAMVDDDVAGNLWCFGRFSLPGFYNEDSPPVVIPAGNIVVSLGTLQSSIAY